ncbi:hypothetical protein HMPREF0201_00977 [Cedecea davisae DSM 4568]|uniref:Uncharacterized protein n=1 Tax=Cedecea davisae DSM 4568 TaxID=566551 RepID=S3IXB0_9ENTR|nr:hypothetical protein HMPREF0201_00977 [Cedecea davisae DSM 4568]
MARYEKILLLDLICPNRMSFYLSTTSRDLMVRFIKENIKCHYLFSPAALPWRPSTR